MEGSQIRGKGASRRPTGAKGSPERDDGHLLGQIADGDRAAFRVLYERYYRRLFHFIYRITGQVELTEEALNDAMLVVWRSAGSFGGRSRVSTWVLGIAYRRALKLKEKSNIRADRFILDERLANEPVGREQEPINEEILKEWLEAGLRHLSPEQRAVVELTYYHGYSYQEIATIVGCPTNTVKTRMFHARANLRKWLPFLEAGRAKRTE